MKIIINEENKNLFKTTLWINFLIGVYNIYLYAQGGWWFNMFIGCLNIGVWVFFRKVK